MRESKVEGMRKGEWTGRRTRWNEMKQERREREEHFNIKQERVNYSEKKTKVIHTHSHKHTYEAFHVNSPIVAQNSAVFGSCSN